MSHISLKKISTALIFTCAPGVPPVAGKPCLPMGIIGAPAAGAPAFQVQKKEAKQWTMKKCLASNGCVRDT